MESWKIILSLVIVLFVLGVGAYFISEANHNDDSNSSVNVSNNDSNHSGNNTTDKLENNTFNESNKDTVSVNKTVDSKNIKNNKESVSPKHVSPVNKTVANHKNVVSNKKSTNTAKSVDSKDIGYKKSLAIAKEHMCYNYSKFLYSREDKGIRVFYFYYNDYNHNGEKIQGETSIVVDKYTGRTSE